MAGYVFLTVEQWTKLPVDAAKSVFVISYFTGIAGAVVALRYNGYQVVHIAYSETDPDCLSVLRTRFPRATSLGDCTKIDHRRFKRWMMDWSRDFRMLLFDSGSPCQGFTLLSAERKGLDDERSALFWYVPPAIVAAGEALAGSGERMT